MRIQIIIISLVVFLILPSEQAIGQKGQEGVNPYSLTEKVLVERSLLEFFEKCNCLSQINRKITYTDVKVIRSDKKTGSFDAVLKISSKKNKKKRLKTKNQSHYDLAGEVRIRGGKVYFDKIYMELEDGTRLVIPIIY